MNRLDNPISFAKDCRGWLNAGPQAVDIQEGERVSGATEGDHGAQFVMSLPPPIEDTSYRHLEQGRWCTC